MVNICNCSWQLKVQNCRKSKGMDADTWCDNSLNKTGGLGSMTLAPYTLARTKWYDMNACTCARTHTDFCLRCSFKTSIYKVLLHVFFTRNFFLFLGYLTSKITSYTIEFKIWYPNLYFLPIGLNFQILPIGALVKTLHTHTHTNSDILTHKLMRNTCKQ